MLPRPSCALDLDGAAMSLGDGQRRRETDARSPAAARPVADAPTKKRSNRRSWSVRADPRTVVDRPPRALRSPRRSTPDMDGRAARRELLGVRHEVDERLLEPPPVAVRRGRSPRPSVPRVTAGAGFTPSARPRRPPRARSRASNRRAASSTPPGPEPGEVEDARRGAAASGRALRAIVPSSCCVWSAVGSRAGSSSSPTLVRIDVSGVRSSWPTSRAARSAGARARRGPCSAPGSARPTSERRRAAPSEVRDVARRRIARARELPRRGPARAPSRPREVRGLLVRVRRRTAAPRDAAPSPRRVIGRSASRAAGTTQRSIDGCDVPDMRRSIAPFMRRSWLRQAVPSRSRRAPVMTTAPRPRELAGPPVAPHRRRADLGPALGSSTRRRPPRLDAGLRAVLRAPAGAR